VNYGVNLYVRTNTSYCDRRGYSSTLSIRKGSYYSLHALEEERESRQTPIETLAVPAIKVGMQRKGTNFMQLFDSTERSESFH